MKEEEVPITLPAPGAFAAEDPSLSERVGTGVPRRAVDGGLLIGS
jgi:hypothetical protein